MDVERHLDPEIALGISYTPLQGIDFGRWTLDTVPELREFMATMPLPPEPPDHVVREDVVVSDPEGRFDPMVRVFRPRAADAPLPAVLWMHGGGFMFGSGLTDDPRLVQWAESLPAVVVSVEYRMGPEHPFPAALDDCYTALRWMHDESEALGIDRTRLAVAGASAGGNLAAALSLLARDRGEIPLVHQMLIYPMLDDRNLTASSHIVDAPIWSRNANFLGWRAYLGHEPGGDSTPIYAAPTRATDLEGLPAAFVSVGALDIFRDEDVEYALRLWASGVSTELHVYPGAPHGFEVIAPFAAVSVQAERDITNAIERALRPADTERER